MTNRDEHGDKGHRPRVLVAEDEDDLRLTMRDWLTLRGYAVQVAKDGLAAMEIASRQPFDVVVTDLKMPHCDGLQLLSGLKALDPCLEVIFLTGQASLEDAIEALRGRSFDFLQKPLHDLRRLDEVIERAIEHRERLGNLTREEGPQAAQWQGLPENTVQAIANEPGLQRAFRYIEAHFREGIGLSEAASATGYSPSYLTNLMRRVTGKTVQQWIIEYKMAEARRLLLESDWPIQRIAASLGYRDPNHFHRRFRQSCGATPQAWRQAEVRTL